MGQHVEAARGDDLGGQGRGAVGIDERFGRTQRGEAMPVFACSDSRSKIAMPVTSLPVPDVVGHAMCGVSGPGTGWPSPTGALT